MEKGTQYKTEKSKIFQKNLLHETVSSTFHDKTKVVEKHQSLLV